MNTLITVSTTIHAPIDLVWETWTQPEHITQWAFASDTWEAPAATNDLRIGGTFSTRMAAKDGSARFDFTGVYTEVVEKKHLAYTIEGGRTVTINFSETPEGIIVNETFEAETENSEEMQRNGWQSILNNFKTYTESLCQ